MVAVRAIDGGNVADGHVLDVGHVNHGDIHGDDAHDGRELAAHQHAAAIPERAMDAVAVARSQHTDQRRALRHKRGVVADSFARGNAA